MWFVTNRYIHTCEMHIQKTLDGLLSNKALLCTGFLNWRLLMIILKPDPSTFVQDECSFRSWKLIFLKGAVCRRNRRQREVTIPGAHFAKRCCNHRQKQVTTPGAHSLKRWLVAKQFGASSADQRELTSDWQVWERTETCISLIFWNFQFARRSSKPIFTTCNGKRTDSLQD